jgi:hypothetical protein
MIVPPPGLVSADIIPLCDSMIPLLIARPSPVPFTLFWRCAGTFITRPNLQPECNPSSITHSQKHHRMQ